MDKEIENIKKELQVFKTVQLNEEEHTYNWVSKDGQQMKNKTSMTSLIHKYTQPFNREIEAEKYAQKYGLDKNEVLKEWDRSNKISQVKGTAIHAYMEYLFKNIEPKYMYNVQEIINIFGEDVIADKWEKLVKIGEEFHQMAIGFLIPIACELKIADDETGIAGAIDLLCLHKDTGDIVIVDYKSNKEIISENKYNQYLLPPLDYLPDINFIHYSLQLNGYQYILEKNTSLKLRKKHFLIWINENNDTFKIFPTLDLYNESKYMIENS